jgi:hypothetical protein
MNWLDKNNWDDPDKYVIDQRDVETQINTMFYVGMALGFMLGIVAAMALAVVLFPV